MYEYLAYIALPAGGLLSALDTPAPDDELLAAAAEIINALIVGGPAEDIDSYSAADRLLERWLELMDDRARTLCEFTTIRSVQRFCDCDDWDKRLAGGRWTDDKREAVRRHASLLLEDARWPPLVRESLGSSDRVLQWMATAAARTLGIDPFDHLLVHLDEDPLSGPGIRRGKASMPSALGF